MNKLFRRTVAVFTAAATALSGTALGQSVQPPVQCAPAKALVVAYFNGVLNSVAAASSSKEALRRIHGDIAPTGEKILYHVMYNSTGGPLEDFPETFEMRSEQTTIADRFELVWEKIQGGDEWWQKIVNVVPAVIDLRIGLEQDFLVAVTSNLASLIASPPKQSNVATHQSRIRAWSRDGRKMVFVAHSQGNLFATPAYDYALTQVVSSESVRVVHVAPAVPPSGLRGGHTLSNTDFVIKGLRVTGLVPDDTDNVPLDRPPGFNGKTDFKGHGFQEIYLNKALTTFNRIYNQIQTAMSQAVAPTPRISQPAEVCEEAVTLPEPPATGDVPIDPHGPITDPFKPDATFPGGPGGPTTPVSPPVPPTDPRIPVIVPLTPGQPLPPGQLIVLREGIVFLPPQNADRQLYVRLDFTTFSTVTTGSVTLDTTSGTGILGPYYNVWGNGLITPAVVAGATPCCNPINEGVSVVAGPDPNVPLYRSVQTRAVVGGVALLTGAEANELNGAAPANPLLPSEKAYRWALVPHI